MRLNQYIASAINISRRQADVLIGQGLVEVDGELGEFHNQITGSNQVRVFQKGSWQQLGNASKIKTVIFYKPIFCLTTRKDPEGRKTIYDHLPKMYHHLKPAGRLDYMTEGLLILSNDGNLIQSLSHPSFESEKHYVVGLHKPLSGQDITRFKQGMVIEDYKLNSVVVEPFNQGFQTKYEYLKLDPKLIWYRFILTEGRNNQIRKMCETVGLKVQRLVRLSQGGYEMSPELYQHKVLVVN